MMSLFYFCIKFFRKLFARFTEIFYLCTRLTYWNKEISANGAIVSPGWQVFCIP